MITHAGSLAQFPVLSPAAEKALRAEPGRRRRRPSAVEVAERALFAVGLAGSAVMMVSFCWQLLQ